jgi:vibriolysin
MYHRASRVAGLFLLSLMCAASASERPLGPRKRLASQDIALTVPDSTLERQYQALSAMPSVTVSYSALGPVRLIQGDLGIVLSGQTRALRKGQPAPELLAKFGDVLLANGTERLSIRLNQLNSTGDRMIKLQQSIGGIPVLYGSVSLTVSEATGMVLSMSAAFLPDRGLPRSPRLTAAEAETRTRAVIEQLGEASPGSIEISGAPGLAYHGTAPGTRRGRLVWIVHATYVPADKGAPVDRAYWIDAANGEYVGYEMTSRAVLNRTAYTAGNASPAPASFPSGLTVLFAEGGSSPDSTAMNAYNYMGDTHVALDAKFGSNPDPIGLVVHYGVSHDNAHYSRTSGVDYIRFGDGNAAISMGPLANSRDVVAHDPMSDPQSAAIDEGFSDVIATVVDTHHRVVLDSATWTIAEVFTSDPARGLRSLADPMGTLSSARDWFPARSLSRQEQSRHANSTIMGHAYKLLVTGGFHVRAGQPIGTTFTGTIPSLFVTAVGQDKAARIFYRAFEDDAMDTFPSFQIMKSAAENAATQLYGQFEREAVDRAFRAVGVGHECTVPPPPPVLNLENYFCKGKHRLWWNQVSGATSYHAQRKPGGWPWELATTIVDGNFSQCLQTVASTVYARLRACNGCGCSDWSQSVVMVYHPQCL